MRKLALDDAILKSIEKPERYIGGEMNSVMKDAKNVDIRFAMCFPDTYEVGMSNIGLQILYNMFNSMENVWCERAFSPLPDLDAVMREKCIPLFGLESQDPLADFDFIGFTLGYEMCYTNILQMLDLSHIPLSASDRDETDPIVIGGGVCTYNPEPLYKFFDLFYIGEGEISYKELFELYNAYKKEGRSREDFLKAAASIPGIYAPAFYEPKYKEDGTIESFEPICDDVPKTIKRVICTEFSKAPYPMKPVMPFVQAVMDRMVLEIQRGCIRGCRFCQAGYIYRPLRDRPEEQLESFADSLIKNTGYDEISLSSLSSSDYKELPKFMDYLMDTCGRRKINISLPSLRIDKFSLDVMSKVQDVNKSSTTFAPEAGSQKMRDRINKNLSEEDILNGAIGAFKAGWNKVKLYFMLGLPGEDEEDLKGIAYLSEKIAKAYYETIPKEERKGKVQINASGSFFVPKPFTAFQWAPMDDAETFLKKAYLVKDTFREQLNNKSMRFKYHDADISVLEGVFARGDRKVADVIETAYKKGAMFDAWNELYKADAWSEAFDETGVDPKFYYARAREEDEIFPWDFIDIGVTKKFLLDEWKKSIDCVTTPDCRTKCAGCGAARFKCGVCTEKR